MTITPSELHAAIDSYNSFCSKRYLLEFQVSEHLQVKEKNIIISLSPCACSHLIGLQHIPQISSGRRIQYFNDFNENKNTDIVDIINNTPDFQCSRIALVRDAKKFIADGNGKNLVLRGPSDEFSGIPHKYILVYTKSPKGFGLFFLDKDEDSSFFFIISCFYVPINLTSNKLKIRSFSSISTGVLWARSL